MSEKILYIHSDQFEETVLKSDRPVVVDFYSTECPPCEALAAKYEPLSEIYGEDILFIKIFRQENRELAKSLGVSGSPTVLFYDKGERVGETFSGGIKRSDLERGLDALLTPERAKELHAARKPIRTECDVLIIGAGPAGLTAGLYLAQARFNTIIVDKALAGGNVSLTHQVSNFPGFVEPVPGWELADRMANQAKAAGAHFREAVDITHVDLNAKTIEIDGIETLHAKKIIIGTGSAPRVIGVKGEVEYKGKGVSYCATCDAKYFPDKHVVVIGGGNSAVEEALFITKFASQVTIIHQFDHFQANKQAQEKAFANEKINVLFEHEPREFVKVGNTVGLVKIQDLKTGEMKDIPCDGVFVFAGMVPNLDLFPDAFELDQWGYIKTDAMQHTNRKDWFAIGDVASKRFRQITTATGDGTVVAMAVSAELEAETRAKVPAEV